MRISSFKNWQEKFSYLDNKQKIILSSLIIVHLIILLGISALSTQQSYIYAPRAILKPEFIFPHEEITYPEEESTLIAKLNRLRVLGVTAATKEPYVYKMIIEQRKTPVYSNIPVRTPVMWIVGDQQEHMIVFSDGYQSPLLSAGDILSRAFNEKGQYSYYDLNNPKIRGVITVD